MKKHVVKFNPIKIPSNVAIPFPPLKPVNIGNRCPTTTKTYQKLSEFQIVLM